MSGRPAVPDPIVARLRLVCLELPEVVEEKAWVGTRWCVRKKNFAHVVMIADGYPPAYAQAAGTDGPACVLTFRLPIARLETPRFARVPFFRPVWFPNIVGMTLADDSDWDAIDALLTDSYRVLAPAVLAARVEVR
jgi:hypothetical protein